MCKPTTTRIILSILNTVDWSRRQLVDFNAGKTQFVLFDRSNNTSAIDVKINGCVLEEKSFFKMLGFTFSFKLDWRSYIISIAKTASKKIEALIRSMKFVSPEVALYLYKSNIRPCVECCLHFWAGAPSPYFGLLDKLEKRTCIIFTFFLHLLPLLNLWLFIEMYSA